MRLAKEGVDPKEHEELLEDLGNLPSGRPEPSLLPFLRAATQPSGLLKVEPANEEIVYILGTSAPACQLIKSAVLEICDSIVAGNDLGAAAHLLLARHTPHLGRFLLFHMAVGRRRKAEVRKLLKDLVKVSSPQFRSSAHANRTALQMISKLYERPGKAACLAT